MVSRVVSKHVVEFNIIDLVGGLSLESLGDDVQLLLAHLQAEIVEDGAEASEVDEAAATSVFVLEVWLD